MTKFHKTDIEPVRIPIDGSLDLHAFSPEDVVSVVDEYLRECLKKEIYEVKIIHGKGRGILRRTVHAFLERHPDVQTFMPDTGPSGWGATQVILNKKIKGRGFKGSSEGQKKDYFNLFAVHRILYCNSLLITPACAMAAP